MDKCRPETLLSEKKIKVTRQRITVLGLIIEKDSPFCANDLFSELSGSMDIVTIYRNLQLLCGAGILREVMTKVDRQYFELSCVHNPSHPHFYCSLCKKIFCMKTNNNYTFPRIINPDENYIIHEAVLQFNGICPECQA